MPNFSDSFQKKNSEIALSKFIAEKYVILNVKNKIKTSNLRTNHNTPCQIS